MQVFDDVTACTCTLPEVVLTIGNFDGFHRGHQHIVAEVNRMARARGGTSALMSLWPHPRTFFNPGTSIELLTSPEQKLELLSGAGLDAYFVLPFNASVARMDRETFLREIVLDKCRARSLVVGHDFSFGAGARGDFNYLSAVADSLDLEVVKMPPLESEHGRISSTLIRDVVKQGDMEGARALLGRPYSLRGKVVAGRGLGRDLGYPTANIEPPVNLLPSFGIYGAKVSWGAEQAIGAVNIGVAPTVAHSSPMVEVHLLDVDTDLVGRELSVDLYHRVRSEKKFSNLDALKAAIEKDIVAIRDYFRM